MIGDGQWYGWQERRQWDWSGDRTDDGFSMRGVGKIRHHGDRFLGDEVGLGGIWKWCRLAGRPVQPVGGNGK